MERRPNHVAAVTATIALVVGGAVLSSELPTHEISEAVAAQAPKPEPVHCGPELASKVVMDNMNWQDVQNQVLRTKYFASPDEYNAYNQRHYVEFLGSKGITVTGVGPRDDGDYQYPAGSFNESNDNTWPFDLATIPDSIIRASGLKHLEMAKPPNYFDYTYVEPPHSGNTLQASGSFELTAGLAAMILDNYCSPEQLASILKAFEDITHQAGVTYDPSYKPNYKMSQAASKKFWSKYDNIFIDQEALKSPRDELVLMLSDMIDGQSVDPYPYKNTPNAQKVAIAKGILQSIEPNIFSYFFVTGNMAYGTHGLHPQQIVYRVNCLIAETNGKTKAEQDHVFAVDVGDAMPDPKLPNCDDYATKKTSKSPWLSPEAANLARLSGLQDISDRLSAYFELQTLIHK